MKSGGFKKESIIPGFSLTFGFTVFYVSVLILIPLSMIFINTVSMDFSEFLKKVTEESVVSAYKVSFGCALVASLINGVFGFMVAWILARYEFKGKKYVDAIVDLPFALPTAVAGIALTTIYSEKGAIGGFLKDFGIDVAFTPLGIIVALTFIGLPFVVRTMQPVIESLDRESEEGAACLGASKFVIFRKIILPQILPSLVSGISLSFGRALGEYGSVVFISGNIPFKTEIAPLIIRNKLEQYDYAGATAIALVLLVISFSIFLVINILQIRRSRKYLA